MSKPITHLDLGGTACWESNDVVGISLDGTYCDDEVVQKIIGDYNHMPFPDNTFDKAHGTCYVEDTFDAAELYRVLKPGGTAFLTGCAEYATREEEAAQAEGVCKELAAAGFIIDCERDGDHDAQQIADGDPYYEPHYRITKPTH